ncbi:LysM repeat protein [Sporosarcina luteola]|nr:LysM repeat protein [Sporosarcina luteola]
MKNNDYQFEFEEHRKEIEIDSELNSELPSRSELHGKGRRAKTRSSHTLINTILGVFTLIPILIFGYVIYNFYNQKDSSNTAQVEDNGFQYEMQSGPSPGGGDTSEAVGKEDDDKEDGNAESKGQVNEKPETGETGQASSKTDQATEKPQQPVKQEPAKPEKKPVKTPEKKQETKQVANQQAGKVHVVKKDETLYRISVNYYGSDVGINKIKQANGLTSNEIRVGQKLIIP